MISRLLESAGIRFNRQKAGGRLLPADINQRLRDAMLDRQNQLEDANYGKVVPNVYIVTIGGDNYRQNYAPIAAQTCRQWEARLEEELATTNSRQGRGEFRFLGPVRVHLQPADDLADHELRIDTRLEADVSALVDLAPEESADDRFYLESLPDGQRWPLPSATSTVGVSRKCSIRLPMKGRHLISEQHFRIECNVAGCTLLDGSPDGTPSRHGTFVNGQQVKGQGRLLQDGDVVVLGATDPQRPRPDFPGSAGFLFRETARLF